jgi:hypothetical protein
MTTSTLHLKLQRSRFTQHALDTVNAFLAAPLRSLQGASTPAPVVSAAAKAALEAQEVREMARTVARSQPGFAADLAAAADRHELKHAG